MRGPEIGTISGVARSWPLTEALIENSTFRYSSTAGALQVIDSTNAVVTNNLFGIGSNAFGINDSSGAKVEGATCGGTTTPRVHLETAVPVHPGRHEDHALKRTSASPITPWTVIVQGVDVSDPTACLTRSQCGCLV